MEEFRGQVGEIVVTKVPVLGNKAGAVGVCYYNYGSGAQYIFENGQYDGFDLSSIRISGKSEYDYFLKPISFCNKCAEYIFKHVLKVTEDFDNGYWAEHLSKE